MCVCTHIFVYSNISEAIFMNYHVYRKKELSFDAQVCVYICVWGVNLLKMIYPVMRFDIKLQQFLVLVICIINTND